MRDLSANATQWWSEGLAVSNEYYATWLAASPIDRVSLKPSRQDRFDTGPFTRVEHRAVSLLLKAVPDAVKDEAVSQRRLSSIELVGLVLTTYQPGGLRERSALLKYLTAPETPQTESEALRGVRRWTRWIRRATELDVAIPDATLLVSGLDVLTSKALAGWPEAQFRLQTFRHQHSIDHEPIESHELGTNVASKS